LNKRSLDSPVDRRLNRVKANGFQGHVLRSLMLFLLQAGVACHCFGADSRDEALGKQPGARLLELCRPVTTMQSENPALDESALSNARACTAFIDGFIWGHAWAAWREAKDMWFCLPQGFPAEQGARDVVDYLSAHPDRLDEDSHLLVFLALTAAHPRKR
jgi:Rap1a immunity proteins